MLINKDSIVFEYINIYSLVEKKIGIPIFQRFYDWKEKQAKETLDNLLESISNNSKQIYMLDFIWYDEDEKVMLADGQQRIVTLNILIKAINDYIDEQNLNIVKLRLFSISYDNIDFNKKYYNAFNNYMSGPFKKMYLHLFDFVKSNKDNLTSLIDAIKNKIYVYMKKTCNADDAFTIFTQINTGGKPLSKDEVIKTTFDQYKQVYGLTVNPDIKTLKKGIASYYKVTQIAKGNFDTIAIMSFMKQYIVKDKTSFVKFCNFISIIEKTSTYSISSVIEYINRSQLFDILNVMAIKGIDVNVKKDYLRQILFPLCLLSIVMTIKKSNPGGIIRSLYLEVIEDIKKDKTPTEICAKIATFINDNDQICKLKYDDFVAALGSSDLPYRYKEALLIIDVINRNVSSDIIVANINLEHIYPQNPHNDWAINGWPTNHDEMKDLINNIGNFILLNEAVNKAIKNKYIDYKRVEYDRIIPRDLSLQTPMNTVDFNRFKIEKKTYITERQYDICEKIYNSFTLAQVILTK